MSFLNLFKGPTPQKLEEKGDALYEAGDLGNAKLSFERALEKSDKDGSEDSDFNNRLVRKINRIKNTLARNHLDQAINLMDGGYTDDALDMIRIAREVAADDGLQNELVLMAQKIREQETKTMDTPFPVIDDEEEAMPESLDGISEEAYFQALLNTLPEQLQAAYPTYGNAFRTGYIALNQGDFHMAGTCLEEAMEESPDADSYIPLELATAYINLNMKEKAENLLERFVAVHGDILPAYRLLCEIYWENNDFHRAQSLLSTVPDTIKESVAVYMLQGETLFLSGQLAEAKRFYETLLKNYRWNETFAKALGETCEALGEMDQARDIYKQIMGRCTSCHGAMDPMIQQKYADISFQKGILTNEILELYLDLARNLPEHRAANFQKISRIYKSKGNDVEAARFHSFFQRAKQEHG